MIVHFNVVACSKRLISFNLAVKLKDSINYQKLYDCTFQRNGMFKTINQF